MINFPPRTALLFFLALLSACAPITLPPSRAPIDPLSHETYLLAFSADEQRMLVLVRLDERDLNIYEYTRWGTKTPLGTLPESLGARLTPWPSRAELGQRIAQDAIGTTIRQLGYRWAQLDPAETPLFQGQRILLRDGSIRLQQGKRSSALLNLPPVRRPQEITWLWSPSKRILGVELLFAGKPRIRGIYTFDLARIASQSQGPTIEHKPTPVFSPWGAPAAPVLPHTSHGDAQTCLRARDCRHGWNSL